VGLELPAAALGAIEKAAEEEKGPCSFTSSEPGGPAIRDLFQPDIGEILVIPRRSYDQALSFMSTVMPANSDKVKLYATTSRSLALPDRAPDRERLRRDVTSSPASPS